MIERRRGLRPALAFLAVALLAACAGEPPSRPDDEPPSSLPRGDLLVSTGDGEVRVEVEIAETPEERVQGLRFRQDLPAGAGMVFLPEEPELQAFVMEDTLIPLSVAWWDEGGRIVAIEDMDPCRADPCPLYGPHGETAGAVEVNQGFFDRHGVEVGDRVRLFR
jgi:uncharacterized membrane protein (UPF0127 family)